MVKFLNSYYEKMPLWGKHYEDRNYMCWLHHRCLQYWLYDLHSQLVGSQYKDSPNAILNKISLGSGALHSIAYLSETHLKLKYHEISFAHNLFCKYLISSICIEQDEFWRDILHSILHSPQVTPVDNFIDTDDNEDIQPTGFDLIQHGPN